MYQPISHPWSRPAEAVLERADVDAEVGLQKREASKRRKQFGRNQLRQTKKRSNGQIFIAQFKSTIIFVLITASVLSFIFTDWVDGVAIAAAVLLNTFIGFFMERKAVRSMEALRQMERLSAKTLRSGRVRTIHAVELVPGDIIVFEGGDLAAADARLLESSRLQVDESMLTGESVPVSKQIEPVDASSSVVDRRCMLFKGTAVTRGSGKAVVTATGMNTELGHIASLSESAEAEFTPLEKRLGRLGRRLLWLTFAILIGVAGLGVVRGKGILIMVETAVALAVAAVPEGLPIVATIAMARGMLRMARHNALVNRLAAVETLGGTNIICTDKTGTLTENKMTVAQVVLPTGTVVVNDMGSEKGGLFNRDGTSVNPTDDEALMEALRIGVLCNNASWENGDEDQCVGDPLEVALMVAGTKAGLNRRTLLHQHPEAREEAFDSKTLMMATFHQMESQYYVAVKGAPEAVIPACSTVKQDRKERPLDEHEKKHWLSRNQGLAREGLRILALAVKQVDSLDAQPYEALTLVGLVGIDPPRETVKQAIGSCREAGVRVVMVTGDQADTALAIASKVGLTTHSDDTVIHGSEIKSVETLSTTEKERLLKGSIFVRVTPSQKLDLIQIHQQHGSVVAMTGDGVNDAPGLHKADIGVAMGQRGTQVAQDASDMILKDDSFATVVLAIKEGRIIFNNIRQFIVYLLSGNASEILIVLFAALLNIPLPILPLQILLLNAISDVFPALALGLGAGSDDVMKLSPRNPHEPVLTGRHWSAVFGYGALIAAAVLAAYGWALFVLNMPRTQVVSISFLTLAFARLWHIFNMRGRRSRWIKNEIVSNPFVWMSLGLCTTLILAVMYLPGLSGVFHVMPPGLPGAIIIIAASLVPFVVVQCLKAGVRVSKSS